MRSIMAHLQYVAGTEFNRSAQHHLNVHQGLANSGRATQTFVGGVKSAIGNLAKIWPGEESPVIRPD
jgi:hypothetical protein